MTPTKNASPFVIVLKIFAGIFALLVLCVQAHSRYYSWHDQVLLNEFQEASDTEKRLASEQAEREQRERAEAIRASEVPEAPVVPTPIERSYPVPQTQAPVYTPPAITYWYMPATPAPPLHLPDSMRNNRNPTRNGFGNGIPQSGGLTDPRNR